MSRRVVLGIPNRDTRRLVSLSAAEAFVIVKGLDKYFDVAPRTTDPVFARNIREIQYRLKDSFKDCEPFA